MAVTPEDGATAQHPFIGIQIDEASQPAAHVLIGLRGIGTQLIHGTGLILAL